jgi:hypothetical protein
MLRQSIVSRHVIVRQSIPYKPIAHQFRSAQVRGNATATPTLADAIVKPISEAPESIQEETIKGDIQLFVR